MGSTTIDQFYDKIFVNNFSFSCGTAETTSKVVFKVNFGIYNFLLSFSLTNPQWNSKIN